MIGQPDRVVIKTEKLNAANDAFYGEEVRLAA